MTPEIIDAANELVQKRLDQAIQAHRIDRNAVSATHCDECGDAIEEARRRAVPGCLMCASCQADAEIRGKHRGMKS
ncbi:TraR/DksA family transcriptional regulator [Citrobacter bitternis]|uniref:TraR/DksA family transcriptional regulator n=1 Tax=Citrobacter bitternis TaxID=1585982 RepID=A0ABW1Q2X9_9ENTR